MFIPQLKHRIVPLGKFQAQSEERYTMLLRSYVRAFFLFILVAYLSVSSAFAIKTKLGVETNYKQWGIAARTTEYGPLSLSVPVSVGETFGRINILRSVIVGKVGGVIFVEIAKPTNDLKGKCPSLSYHPTESNGSRLHLRFASWPETKTDLPDWEIKPLVKFVDSQQLALISFLSKDYITIGDDIVKRLSINPALVDTLVGFNLMIADQIRSYPKFLEIPGLFSSQRIPGYNIDNAGYFKTQAEDANETLMQVRQQLANKQLMFTDKGEEFVFSIQDGYLDITGTPYYVVLDRDDEGNGILLEAPTNTLKSLRTKIRNSNPMVFDSAYRNARYIAFFRYLQKECKKEWSNFSTRIRENEDIDDIEIKTPLGIYQE